VGISVSDQEAAVQFYVGLLGFKVQVDAPTPRCRDDSDRPASQRRHGRRLTAMARGSPDVQVSERDGNRFEIIE